jgi:hypothetical protein
MENGLKMPALILCAVCVGMAASAKADFIGPLTTTAPITSVQTDWNLSLPFPQFDPSLGTLDSVEIAYSASFSSTYTITNIDPQNSSDGGVSTTVAMSLQDAGDNLESMPLILTGGGGGFFLMAGQSTTEGVSQSGSSDNTYSDPAILSEFTGTGSISLDASTGTSPNLSSNGGTTTYTQVTDASMTGTVTYGFTPAVPEPASMGLIVGAMGLLAGRRRHRV